MSARITLATAGRVLAQLRHDHRTLAMLIVVPVRAARAARLDLRRHRARSTRIGAPLLGIFPFVVMFLVTSVATLRERTSGTLERLLTMPIGKLDLLLGYGLAFGLVAVVQASAATTLSVYAARPRRRPDRCGCCWSSPSSTRCSAWRSACSSARSRPPSSRPCSSCRRSCCRSSCSAGCWCRATRWTTCCTLGLQRAAAVLRGRRHARPHDERRGRPGRLGRPLRRRAGDPAGARSRCGDPAPSDA